MVGFRLNGVDGDLNRRKEIPAIPKKRTVINILFIVLTVALMTACSGKDAKPEQKVYIAWSNNQESYSV